MRGYLLERRNVEKQRGAKQNCKSRLACGSKTNTRTHHLKEQNNWPELHDRKNEPELGVTRPNLRGLKNDGDERDDPRADYFREGKYRVSD